MRLLLPFPPALLSGHAKGNANWAKIAATKKYRNEANLVARGLRWNFTAPDEGDIRLHMIFEPPNNRGDRYNFMARAKCQIDGVADALGINDKRFLPSIEFLPPVKGGRLTVIVGEACEPG